MALLKEIQELHPDLAALESQKAALADAEKAKLETVAADIKNLHNEVHTEVAADKAQENIERRSRGPVMEFIHEKAPWLETAFAAITKPIASLLRPLIGWMRKQEGGPWKYIVGFLESIGLSDKHEVLLEQVQNGLDPSEALKREDDTRNEGPFLERLDQLRVRLAKSVPALKEKYGNAAKGAGEESDSPLATYINDMVRAKHPMARLNNPYTFTELVQLATEFNRTKETEAKSAPPASATVPGQAPTSAPTTPVTSGSASPTSTKVTA